SQAPAMIGSSAHLSFDPKDDDAAIDARASALVLERLSLLMEEADASRSMLMEDLRQIRRIGQSITHSTHSLEDYLQEVKQRELLSRSREVFSDLEEYFRLFDQRFEGCQESLEKIQEIAGRIWKEIARSRRIPAGRIFGVLQKTLQELC